MFKTLVLLLRTVRYLRPIQIGWRFWLKFSGRRPTSLNVPGLVLREWSRVSSFPVKHTSFCQEGRFVFLSREFDFAKQINWNHPALAKLWLYNLHYFDYLNQEEMDRAGAYALINDWIAQNAVGQGNGWEPYPISLRVVNWIKLFRTERSGCRVAEAVDPDSAGVAVFCDRRILDSLYLQARYLRRHLEFHLLGNHLFKNAVALLFAGAYFEGSEADEWLRKGVSILESQLREQILADGGHFERSPMYHAIMLEDLLDCINVAQACECVDTRVLEHWRVTARSMVGFLKDVLHTDGELPFFNDSAIGIASKPAKLFGYAERLGIPDSPCAAVSPSNYASQGLAAIAKPAFGLYVLKHSAGRMLVDVGEIGPDYLPGHAHCDTLSYEVSIDTGRLLVNSGTYEYAGSQRNHYRATAAHNTLRLDEQEQHEIWSTFRVARRGYPVDVALVEEGGGWSLTGGHTGYRRLSGSPTHRRQIHLTSAGWVVRDTVEGKGRHRAEVFLHLHPDVVIERLSEEGALVQVGARRVNIATDKGLRFRQARYDYSPEFGLAAGAWMLVLEAEGELPLLLEHRIVICDLAQT